jgi:hypothetical protein
LIIQFDFLSFANPQALEIEPGVYIIIYFLAFSFLFIEYLCIFTAFAVTPSFFASSTSDFFGTKYTSDKTTILPYVLIHALNDMDILLELLLIASYTYHYTDTDIQINFYHLSSCRV